MQTVDEFEAGDDQLRALLRNCRPAPDLPPRFQHDVWRRIEQSESGETNSSIQRLIVWLWRPRVIAPAIASILLLAASAGAVNATSSARDEARTRYIAAVAPYAVE